MVAIIDEVTRELDASPLRPRRRRQMVHQRTALGKEREHVTMATQVADLLHLGKHVVIAFAHADDQMRAEALRSENLGRGMR